MKPSPSNTSFSTLQRFRRAKAPVERCELCSAELGADHQHLIDPVSRKLTCACDACTILFSNRTGKYRRVPRRVRSLPDFRMTDAQWDALMIPISMVFFFNSTSAEKMVAFYPSPAGATESLLDLAAWNEIVEENPLLKDMEPDTEALLINRVGNERQYYIAPIDECYKLVGLMRAHWRGLSGGREVWEEIGRFFTRLRQRASPAKGESRA